MGERARIRNEFKTRWWDLIRERYNEYLKQTYRAWWTVERCEIKEWKWQIWFWEFSESRLKVLDDWMLSVYMDWHIEFDWKIKKFVLKNSDYDRYVMYDNWVLFYKIKWKNVFMKIHYTWNDKENIECLLRGVPFMYEDEDTDYIYQIIDFVEKKNFEFDSQEVADLLGVDDEEARRIIEKMWKCAGLHYYRDWEEEKTELEKMDEKIIAEAEKKEKRKETWRTILFILGAIFLWLFLLMIIWLSG